MTQYLSHFCVSSSSFVRSALKDLYAGNTAPAAVLGRGGGGRGESS
jgi:hypothetical protein